MRLNILVLEARDHCLRDDGRPKVSVDLGTSRPSLDITDSNNNESDLLTATKRRLLLNLTVNEFTSTSNSNSIVSMSPSSPGSMAGSYSSITTLSGAIPGAITQQQPSTIATLQQTIMTEFYTQQNLDPKIHSLHQSWTLFKVNELYLAPTDKRVLYSTGAKLIQETHCSKLNDAKALVFDVFGVLNSMENQAEHENIHVIALVSDGSSDKKIAAAAVAAGLAASPVNLSIKVTSPMPGSAQNPWRTNTNNPTSATTPGGPKTPIGYNSGNLNNTKLNEDLVPPPIMMDPAREEERLRNRRLGWILAVTGVVLIFVIGAVSTGIVMARRVADQRAQDAAAAAANANGGGDGGSSMSMSSSMLNGTMVVVHVPGGHNLSSSFVPPGLILPTMTGTETGSGTESSTASTNSGSSVTATATGVPRPGSTLQSTSTSTFTSTVVNVGTSPLVSLSLIKFGSDPQQCVYAPSSTGSPASMNSCANNVASLQEFVLTSVGGLMQAFQPLQAQHCLVPDANLRVIVGDCGNGLNGGWTAQPVPGSSVPNAYWMMYVIFGGGGVGGTGNVNDLVYCMNAVGGGGSVSLRLLTTCDPVSTTSWIITKV